MDEIDALLNRRDAVGDLRERVEAHLLLLLEGEGRVIRRDGADGARAQAVPEHVLMAFVAQRRRHHVLRAFEIGLRGVGLIEHEVRRHRFDPHVDATVARVHRLAHGIVAGGMDRIDVRTGECREAAEVVDPAGFHDRWPRRSVPLGSGAIRSEEGALHRVNGLRVLAVRRHDDAELLGQRHRGEEVFVREIQRALVREKDLEGRDAVVHDPSELLADLWVEAHDGHVK